MRFSSLAAAVAALLSLLLVVLPANAVASEYVTFLHADVQGSPLLATDEQGQVLWQEEYEPWGARQVKEAAAETASRGSEVWYTGKEEESSLGMYYYGARWYAPSVGQFVSIDPASLSSANPRTFSRYAYANNNPVRYVDPDGREAAAAPWGWSWGTMGEMGGRVTLRAALGYIGTPIVIVGSLFLPSQTSKDSELHDPAWRPPRVARAEEAAADGGVDVATDNGPSLPTEHVGTKDKKSRQQGNRQNNGPLAPEHGGTGDAEKDFEQLTGGITVPLPEGASHPPGTKQGANGITLRPAKGNSGARIDIPANGDKTHETLHY